MVNGFMQHIRIEHSLGKETHVRSAIDRGGGSLQCLIWLRTHGPNPAEHTRKGMNVFDSVTYKLIVPLKISVFITGEQTKVPTAEYNV